MDQVFYLVLLFLDVSAGVLYLSYRSAHVLEEDQVQRYIIDACMAFDDRGEAAELLLVQHKGFAQLIIRNDIICGLANQFDLFLPC